MAAVLMDLAKEIGGTPSQVAISARELKSS